MGSVAPPGSLALSGHWQLRLPDLAFGFKLPVAEGQVGFVPAIGGARAAARPGPLRVRAGPRADTVTGGAVATSTCDSTATEGHWNFFWQRSLGSGIHPARLGAAEGPAGGPPRRPLSAGWPLSASSSSGTVSLS